MMELGALRGDDGRWYTGRNGGTIKVFTLRFYTTAKSIPPGGGGRCPNVEEMEDGEAMSDVFCALFVFEPNYV